MSVPDGTASGHASGADCGRFSTMVLDFGYRLGLLSLAMSGSEAQVDGERGDDEKTASGNSGK
jgi:hypothetical protein